jgi:uncharacterized phage protein (TIGR01671 family)
MNREILFRGMKWDKSGWVYGDLIQSTEGDRFILAIEQGDVTMYDSVDPKTVGQCTGLRDKNGKQIYEGDILIGDFPLLIVGYCLETASFGASKTLDFSVKNMYWFGNDIHLLKDGWDVIGNIYENKELIEVGKIGIPDLGNMEYRGPSSHCKACEDESNGVKHLQAQKHTCRKRNR